MVSTFEIDEIGVTEYAEEGHTYGGRDSAQAEYEKQTRRIETNERLVLALGTVKHFKTHLGYIPQRLKSIE